MPLLLQGICMVPNPAPNIGLAQAVNARVDELINARQFAALAEDLQTVERQEWIPILWEGLGHQIGDHIFE